MGDDPENDPSEPYVDLVFPMVPGTANNVQNEYNESNVMVGVLRWYVCVCGLLRVVC